MDKRSTNYAEKKNKKLAALLIAVLALLLFVGIVAAFYSDILTDGGTVNTSTLKIEGEYTVLLNGEETELGAIKNLNPGDVIVIKGNITNTGNQSAWLREKISFDAADQSILSYIQVYDMELYQEDFLSEYDYTPFALPLTDGTAAGSNKVIDGSGDDAQTESGADFDYLGASVYNFSLTVYFAHAAPNSTQGKSIGITVATQALQFRNNSGAEPSQNAWNAIA